MCPSSHLKTERDPVSVKVELSGYLKFRTMNKVHEPNHSEGLSALDPWMCGDNEDI
jgi:hypothetical protein